MGPVIWIRTSEGTLRMAIAPLLRKMGSANEPQKEGWSFLDLPAVEIIVKK